MFPDRIIPAQFALRDGILGLVEPVLSLAEALDRPLDAVRRAFVQARAVQAGFVEACSRLRRTALAASFDRAAVVLGRPYNTHDSFLNLGMARHLERLGLPAIPGTCCLCRKCNSTLAGARSPGITIDNSCTP